MLRLLTIIGCLTLLGCGTSNIEPQESTTRIVEEAAIPATSTCADMHTGIFEFTSNRGSRFTRTDSSQIQYHNDSTVSHFALSWQSDCNYTITLRETNETSYLEYLNRPLVVEITNVSYDTMWFTGTMDSGVVFHDTLVRVDS